MKVLILAGGRGLRLWPLSREALPKQFATLPIQNDSFSLFQKTVKRFLSFIPQEDIWVVTSRDYETLVKQQMQAIDPLLTSQLILEPEQKNTAPAIALALKFLEKKSINSQETILVTPSDHLMAEGLLDSLVLAEKLVHEGKFVLFGIKPYKPDVGYGYIKMTSSTSSDVEAFVEKPSLDKAQEFLNEGSYLWNCGLFVFKSQTFWKELQKCCPSMAFVATSSYEEILQNFSSLPNLSIDYAVIEKTQYLAAIPLNLFWSDIGSWDSIFDMNQKDHNSNVKIGNILDIDTKNCLIIGGKKLISTIGLEDLVIVETDEAIFIGKRGETQKVKLILQELKK